MKKLLTTTAVALTLAFSGLAYAHDGTPGKDHHGGTPPFMEEALSKLPAKDAAQFRDTMKQAAEKDKAMFDQMNKLHDELHDIMTAEKFDKDAYLAKHEELDKLRETMHEKMKANMREGFATALSQLSQPDRKILAEAMKKEHGGFHDHGHWHHHKDGEKAPDVGQKSSGGEEPASDSQ